ncbi:MerR family transcriptional regulator [Plantactinospora sp. CA-290183]|uniref:DNA polymerase III subunit beta family protein n=1 Tax=Plantactinospora sp. CA-290183 TaxID=3240006 RepID=UPI003D91A5B5
MARASGLTVSALRFYDGAGVLPPATVDPATGYRRYARRQLRAARLVAGLRRVDMPLAEITRVLDLHAADPAAVRRLLDAHLRRLEDGLADARREVARVRALLLAPEEPGPDRPGTGVGIRLTLAGRDLAGALDAVRFAVGVDPELPMLGGIWLEVEGTVLRLVATDRYRMAVAEVDADPARGDCDEPARGDCDDEPAAPNGAAGGARTPAVLAPVGFVDRARGLLEEGGPATVALDPAAITLRAGGRRLSGIPLRHDFPDYRRLLREAVGGPDRRRVVVDAVALRERLAGVPARTVVREDDGVHCPVNVLAVDATGRLSVSDPDAPADPDALRIGVNPEFLLDALDAAGPGQLLLELDGPIRPLAVRRSGDDRAFSILMPVRC